MKLIHCRLGGAMNSRDWKTRQYEDIASGEKMLGVATDDNRQLVGIGIILAAIACALTEISNALDCLDQP